MSCLLITVTFFFKVEPHGFGQHTLIKVDNGPYYWSIEQLARRAGEGSAHSVASYDENSNQWVNKRITAAGFSKTNCYCRLSFDNYVSRSLECTPTQLFYCIDNNHHQWVPAYMLRIGDLLLCNGGRTIKVADITLINKPLKVYTLEVTDTHTFLVAECGIVAHNMFVPMAAAGIGFGIPLSIGSSGGGAFGSIFGPVGIVGGVVIGGVIGCIVHACIKSTLAKYDLLFNSHAIATCIEANKNGLKDDDESDKSNEAQAPGKPTENDGFVPKKNWDGKKVKHSRGWGWPDNKGNIWIPSGLNGHGGPHWDVQRPGRCKDYENVVPGGKIRGQK